MALTLDKPIIVANKQNIKFLTVSINSTISGLQAVLVAAISDENGKFVEQISKIYTGTDFDNFWKGFNTGTFLYQEIAKLAGAPIPAPLTMENLFLNVQPNPPPKK